MRATILADINKTIYEQICGDKAAKADPVLMDMLLYALGLDSNGDVVSGGKRLRPLFCCLSCAALCGSYQNALGYAAGLEMLHNFTLVHDDIEDNGDMRHNKATLWKRNGLALALNAGDLLYEMALQTFMTNDHAIKQTDGLPMMMQVSSRLFVGQHRDISFESRSDLTEEEYFTMISGKTGVLLGASFALGALAAGKESECVRDYELAGRLHGIAFQLRDDYLGTWGNEKMLGKSVSGDIMNKKNTLAVIYTAEKDSRFKKRWAEYDGNEAEACWFAAAMSAAGAPEYLQEKCREYSSSATEILIHYRSDNAYQKLQDELIASLLERNK